MDNVFHLNIGYGFINIFLDSRKCEGTKEQLSFVVLKYKVQLHCSGSKSTQEYLSPNGFLNLESKLNKRRIAGHFTMSIILGS